MNTYKTRKINFNETIEVGEWKIKIYTISKSENTSYPIFYREVKARLPEWLSLKNTFNSDNDKIAFLILHFGTEGIFSLINWWVGKNMLNTHIFITPYDNLSEFTRISGDGLAPCIWELEVIDHERKSWMEHVLKQETNPKIQDYLNDTVCIEM